MQNSDLIALAAFGVAILSTIYARRAASNAHRANEITVKNALRPHRLAVFTALVEFLHFCSTYRTLQSVAKVEGTGDLVARLDRFKGEIAQRGPLDMPDVEQLVLDYASSPEGEPVHLTVQCQWPLLAGDGQRWGERRTT